MDAATATGPHPSRAASRLPPQVRLPRLVQTARFMARPIQFFERQRRELGETFRVRLLFGPGEFVFVSRKVPSVAS